MPHYHTTATYYNSSCNEVRCCGQYLRTVYKHSTHKQAKRGQYCTQTRDHTKVYFGKHTHLRNEGYSFDSSKNSGTFLLAFASFVLTFWIRLYVTHQGPIKCYFEIAWHLRYMCDFIKPSTPKYHCIRLRNLCKIRLCYVKPRTKQSLMTLVQ